MSRIPLMLSIGKKIVNYILTLFSALIILISTAVSAEIKNEVVRQEGNRILFIYDLEGTEAEGEVSVKLTIQGKKYETKDLHFKGDIGKVKTGKGKKIFWNVLQDFPKGLSEQFTWELTAGQWQVNELTVLDTKTNLMWTRDGNLAGKEMNWDDAQAYVHSLNNERYAGYNNWRLPNKYELAAMAQYGKDAGYGSSEKKISDYFNERGFIKVQPHYYWSSTVSPLAWFVSMWGGYVFYDVKTGSNYVFPVRDVTDSR